MKVFISWSGGLSNELANEFRTWLPGALQSVKPYFTPSDIEKGAKWSSEISKELEASDVGVLFVTRENLNSSWLLYEAGALSKRIDKSRVCPVIFNLKPEDLPGPLRQFQATEFKEADFRALLRTVNSAAGDSRLQDRVLEDVFDMWWPKLERNVDSIMARHSQNVDVKPIRPDREVLEEILELARLTAKRATVARRVNPEAVSEIIDALERAVFEIQGNTHAPRALEALSLMSRPLKYLINRADWDDEREDAGMRSKLQQISYEYNPHAPEFDDDIPF